MASRLFDGYAEEHAELCAGIGRSIALLRTETDMEARRKLQSAAEAELVKVDDLLQSMELEARSAPKTHSRTLQTRAKTCRTEMECHRKALKQAFCSLPAGGNSSGDEAADNDQRAQLLRMNERVHDGTSKLQKAHRTVLETEAVGISIMSDLQAQRETITHAAGTLQRANEGLIRSKRTLAAIGRRAFANRMIMWLLIALLGAAVLILLFLQAGGGLGRGVSSSANTTAG